MKLLAKISDLLFRVTAKVIIVLMALDVITMLVQVFGRQFGKAPAWTEELSRFLMVWIAFLGSGLLVKEGSHIAVDILQNTVKNEKVKFFFVKFSNVCMFLVGCIILYFGWFITKKNMEQITPALQLPFSVVYLSLPICGFLILLYSVERLIGNFLSGPSAGKGGES